MADIGAINEGPSMATFVPINKNNLMPGHQRAADGSYQLPITLLQSYIVMDPASWANTQLYIKLLQTQALKCGN